MPHRPIWRALLAGLAGLSPAILPSKLLADVYFETSYLPTSSVVSLSSGLLPTAYVVPTAYSSAYFPTSYVATSAVLASETVAYPTATTVVRRSLFRPRRYVERTYYNYSVAPTSYVSATSFVSPTSYFMPTSPVVPTSYVTASSLLPTTYVTRSSITPTSYVIDDGVITTSGLATSYPCETTTAAPTRPATVRSSGASNGEAGRTIVSEPTNAASSNERRPQGMVNGNAGGEDAPSSAVSPPVLTPPAPKGQGAPVTSNPINEPPAYDPGAAAAPTNVPGNTGAEKVVIPGPGQSGTPAQPNETSARIVRRPSNYDVRNILRGRVFSAESRLPEEGVSVILSNVTNNYADRPTWTNADGEFKVSLPDGDWVVKVKMPSGKVYTVGRDYLTASSGRVTDASGRSVPEFVITR